MVTPWHDFISTDCLVPTFSCGPCSKLVHVGFSIPHKTLPTTLGVLNLCSRAAQTRGGHTVCVVVLQLWGQVQIPGRGLLHRRLGITVTGQIVVVN